MRQAQLVEEEKQFSAFVSKAEAGESLTIHRAGKPVAQIIPFLPARSSAAAVAHKPKPALR